MLNKLTKSLRPAAAVAMRATQSTPSRPAGWQAGPTQPRRSVTTAGLPGIGPLPDTKQQASSTQFQQALVRDSQQHSRIPLEVGRALDDARKIEPGGARADRMDALAKVLETHRESLQEPDGGTDGRGEFLADLVTRGLDGACRMLGRWDDKGDGVTMNGRYRSQLQGECKEAFATMKQDNPAGAALYASLVDPGQRQACGMDVSGAEFAEHGVSDKGPYLSADEHLALRDYTHLQSGTFIVHTVNGLIDQHLGSDNNPVSAHVQREINVLHSALDKLAQHPACVVQGDVYKGLRLPTAFQRNGLDVLSSCGGTYPLGRGTSAVTRPGASYVGRPGYGGEAVFRNATGLRLDLFHHVDTLDQPEVFVRGQVFKGKGQEDVSAGRDPRTGRALEFTRHIFEPASSGCDRPESREKA